MMMDAHRLCGELESGAYAIAGVLTGALTQGIANVQRDRARAAAANHHIAVSIHGAAANAFADGNASLYSKLLASDLEVERLSDKVDTLQATVAALMEQRAVILRECQILLAENAALLARKH
jgi:hypothetical protein